MCSHVIETSTSEQWRSGLAACTCVVSGKKAKKAGDCSTAGGSAIIVSADDRTIRIGAACAGDRAAYVLN